MREQASPTPATPKRRQHEQVFEIQSSATEKRREVVKEEREPGKVGTDVCEDDFGRWPVAKQRVANAILRRLDVVRQSLVLGQPLDQRHNGGRVPLRRRHNANVERGRHRSRKMFATPSDNPSIGAAPRFTSTTTVSPSSG